MSKFPTRIICEGRAVLPKMELPACCGSSRWKTCDNKMSQVVSFQTLQLQGLIFTGGVTTCRNWLQVSVGRCGD